ncbi:facilitated trehalose transporter Tret1-like [Vespa mandarinia]|uniref:facilitated trehalose transporter Tret1-like n=1 Tax=Vespa mandarinia TaxID=7446 RepID=UPI00160F48F6|nr:facilitated trehalose transporter Tret1-like [Vespa mandarinia]
MTTGTKDTETKRAATWPQWIASVGVSLLLMQIGLLAGWSSPYIERLLTGKSIMVITVQEASLIVMFLNLGRLFGAFIGAIFVNLFGSKKTILICSIPMSLCWIFVIIADRIFWLYLGRIAGGIGMGMSYSCFSLYLGEIADSNIRGALVTIAMAGSSCGNLFIFVMGCYLSIRISAIVNLIFSIILMILFIWLPDSPHHLIKINQDDRAKKSILWYHRDINVDKELLNLKKFINACDELTTFQALKQFKVPQIRKAMIVTIMLFFYLQICGLNTILFYMETIIKSAQVDIIEPSYIVIIITIFGIVASLLSMMLIDKFGRKILMCFSCMIVTMALIGLGTHFQLLEMNVDTDMIQWLPIVCILLFEMAVYMGLLPVPSAVVGEIFPPNVKCVAASISSIFAAVFSLTAAGTYQIFIDLMTKKYTFWLYAIILITAIPVIIIFLPETKGKTLQEIQNELMNIKPKEVDNINDKNEIQRY